MSDYFDINLLDDYLDLGLKFRVFVDGEYLVVNDPWDLLNDYVGVGYDSKGKKIEFEYMDIDHVLIGSIVLTKEQLSGAAKSKEETPPKEEEGESEQEEAPAPEETETPEQEEEPE
jgi:hypothetical protein